MKKNILLLLGLLSAAATPLFAQYSTTQVRQLYAARSEAATLGSKDLEDFVITDQYTDAHNGITHIYLRQRVNGVEIYDANSSMHLDKNGRVLSLNNRFVANVTEKAPAPAPALGTQAALSNAAAHIDMEITPALGKADGPLLNNQVAFSDPAVSPEEVKIKLYYVSTAQGLKLAWNVNLFDQEQNDWWNIRVDAQNGAIIDKNNWVVKCNVSGSDFAHDYNFADLDLKTDEMHAFGKTSNDGTYNIYPMPVESPNHGSRALTPSPATSNASPFGWHDTDGVAGAEFTITRGNNVYASEDTLAQDKPGYSPDGGSSLMFDFPYAVTASAVANLNTAITNLFYWNNIVHDVFYNYGFDETAGNFQCNNYNKGGEDGDYVKADAQDGSGISNANFATPEDGKSGRMQMYLWPVNSAGTFTVNSPASIAGSNNAVPSSFGPRTFGDINADVVLMKDSNATTYYGCGNLDNRPDLAGRIALVDRNPGGGSSCTYVKKILNAQNSGAIAVIVIQSSSASPTVMTGTGSGAITIPAFMISKAIGDKLKTRLDDTTVNVTIKGNIGDLVYDSDLDNGVMVHEYGHGISTRLTGGPSNSNCLQNAEQAGEGWSDFFALALTAKQGDKMEDARGVGTFVSNEAVNALGIRTYKYAHDMSVNPMTYKSIRTNPEAHYIGSYWATVLWDIYWDMCTKYGWSADIYHGTAGNNKAIQLVIDGLKLQPCSPGMVDSRDAILLADSVNNGGANKDLLWRAFARRGLGYSASQGSSNSATDGTEAFDLPPGVTGVDELKQVMSIQVSPNPAKGEVSLSLPATAQKVEVQLTDVSGRTVMNRTLEADADHRVQLDMGELSNGIYFISVNSNQQLMQAKVVLSR